VYLATDRHNYLLYVGNVWRPRRPGGLGARLGEHPWLDWRQEWGFVWHLPLEVTVSMDVASTIEALAIAVLRPHLRTQSASPVGDAKRTPTAQT
jgi:hypothetical protein